MKMIDVDYILTLEKLRYKRNLKDKRCKYFQERKIREVVEELRKGYKEMAKINESLSELGLEQDIKELNIYEAILIGCEIS